MFVMVYTSLFMEYKKKNTCIDFVFGRVRKIPKSDC
jgi:hypothetical protein